MRLQSHCGGVCPGVAVSRERDVQNIVEVVGEPNLEDEGVVAMGCGNFLDALDLLGGDGALLMVKLRAMLVVIMRWAIMMGKDVMGQNANVFHLEGGKKLLCGLILETSLLC